MAELTRRGALAATAMAGAGALLARTGAADAAEGKHGDELPNFRYALEGQKGKVTAGGSAKEATAKQLPISTGIAGVSMRLKPGGLRELHWHANAAEWAFVIKGRVRTTVIGPDGTAETSDFDPGDVWYFPRGHGHAVQALGPDDAHFILVFDNGHFSEYGTFGISDWLAVTPRAIVARNLGVPKAALEKLPREELYIVAGRVPPEKPAPLRSGGERTPPSTHRYPLLSQVPTHRSAGGTEWLVSAREFPISKTITGIILDLKPGALRELHWHPHANEWQYVIKGRVRISVFGSHGRSRTEDFAPGDAGYVPQGFGHAVENHGDEECRLLIAFDSGEFQEINLSSWLGANPAGLLADNFQLPEAAVEKWPTQQQFIIPAGRSGS